jgi:hypothetical protein
MKVGKDNSYLYVGVHYDLFNDREIGINDKKIGETVTPEIREGQLSKTKSPIGYMFVKLYEFVGGKTAQIVEKNILHSLLSSRNTVGEWFSDEDDRLISDINKALSGLATLGIKYTEIELENDKISPNKKEVIKKNSSNRIYFDVSDVEKASEIDDQYSLWELKTPNGETYRQVYNINTTRANGRKATTKTVINYCNAEKFLSLVDFDYTKLTATFIKSSNNKEDLVA